MRRLDFLDSLRGLAALYVVVFHMTLLPSPTLAVPHWAEALVLNGGTAVTLFFVVSAFSLCHTMRSSDIGPAETRDFYIRRFFRIAPLFYAMLVFYAVRDVLYFGAWHSAADWAKSLLFVFNFFPGLEQGIVWASWTIGVEMVFYLVFPFLFARFRTLAGLLALTFAALLGTMLLAEFVLHLPLSEEAQATFLKFSFFRHLPVFVLGMLCWLVFDRFVAGREHGRAVGAALILGSVWAFHVLLSGALRLGFPDPYYWEAIIYSALVLGLAIYPTRVLVNRLTLFAGRISYSIYLVHPSTILFLMPVYKHIYALGWPTSARFLLCTAVTLGVVLPVSVVTYRWIELPGMRLGKKLLVRRRAVPVPAAAATGSLP